MNAWDQARAWPGRRKPAQAPTAQPWGRTERIWGAVSEDESTSLTPPFKDSGNWWGTKKTFLKPCNKSTCIPAALCILQSRPTDCCPKPWEVSTRLLTHDPGLFFFLMLRQLYFYFLKMSFYLARVAGAYYSHCHIQYNAFLWGQILTSLSSSEESVPRMPQRLEEIRL